jgi:BspA type Leucine rich repeat region (6 copies)
MQLEGPACTFPISLLPGNTQRHHLLKPSRRIGARHCLPILPRRWRLAFARRLLPILLWLALPAAAPAQFSYTTASGEITITGYNGPGGDVTIPDMIDGLPVVHIKRYAFQQRSSLTRVTIPDRVISIGDNAFQFCFSLTEVTLGKSVTRIGVSPFLGCTKLAAITVDSLNPSFSGVDGVLFDRSQVTLIQCPPAKGGDYAIPNTVTHLLDGAFFSCGGLTGVMIPESVTTIERGVFGSNTSLSAIMVDPLNLAFRSVDGVLFNKSQTKLIQYPPGKSEGYAIPNGVTRIEERAFRSCFQLTSVMIPESVSSIGEYAFIGCGRLSAITVDTLNSIYSDVDGVLFDKTQATLVQYPPGRGNYVILNGVTTIADFAFADCTQLASVTIPNSVTQIGNYSFSGCLSLKRVAIPDSVSSIGDYAFQRCQLLTSVAIPASVTHIGDYAFSRCTRLNEIEVDALNPNYSSVFGVLFDKKKTTLIQYPPPRGDYAIPNGVSIIANAAFAECTGRDIIIPNSVTRIGDAVFSGCSRLSRMTIPTSVTNVGSSAFSGCIALTRITISDRLARVGDYAFSSCSRLTGVYFTGNAPDFGVDGFAGSEQAIVYYLPGTTGWDATAGGRPTAVWSPQVGTNDGNFGVRNGQFGFTINWVGERVVVVEACEELGQPVWAGVATNTLKSGSSYFSDAEWANFPSRIYRLRVP